MYKKHIRRARKIHQMRLSAAVLVIALLFLIGLLITAGLYIKYKNTQVNTLSETATQSSLETSKQPLFHEGALQETVNGIQGSGNKNAYGENNGEVNLSKSYGIAMGGNMGTITESVARERLNGVKAAGFDIVRYDMQWDLVQPKNAAEYDWSKFDKIQKILKSNNQKAIVIINRTPLWAREPGCSDSYFCPPADPEMFAAYAKQIVNRYKDTVIAWEVWNEANTHVFWKPHPDPVKYTELLAATHKAIKKVDPSSTVLFGGLSGSTGNGGLKHIDPRTFLEAAYTAGAKDHFDAVAYHPYTNLFMPSTVNDRNGWSKLYSLKPSIRSIMVDNGDVLKPVWLNEIGIPSGGIKNQISIVGQVPSTSDDHVSPEVQAAFAKELYTLANNIPWVVNISWYTYKDNAAKKTTEDYYGILTHDGKHKPIYETLRDNSR